MFFFFQNIDESRLKMKAHCPLVTDLRLKEKTTRIFMCYNPEWLRIGLHIVLGGDSLLQNGSRKRDKEVPFLKLILEKQLFAQNVTAKSLAHNKVVEGIYRPAYTEALGNIILKRIFLLVAALDRAKMESSLPLKSGIDGLDGGSSPLFCHPSQIKSSRQIIQGKIAESICFWFICFVKLHVFNSTALNFFYWFLNCRVFGRGHAWRRWPPDASHDLGI